MNTGLIGELVRTTKVGVKKLVQDGKELLGKARVRKPACDELSGEWCSRGMEPFEFFIFDFRFSI